MRSNKSNKKCTKLDGKLEFIENPDTKVYDAKCYIDNCTTSEQLQDKDTICNGVNITYPVK